MSETASTGSPTLETERLLLRAFTLADADDVQRLAGDMAIADTTLDIPHPYTDGLAEAWIATHATDFAAGTSATFAVTRKADGALVGAIGLKDVQAGFKTELGYWTGRPYWGQGYCTEAARAVLRFAFTELALQRVFAHHLCRNPASGKVMQKLGMKPEGVLRGHVRKWGKAEDIALYGILRSEWRDAGPGSKD